MRRAARHPCPRRRSDTAGVRPRLPRLHRSILRPDARGRGGWRRNGRCRHKASLPRRRGAGIRRNDRRNRQAGPTRAGARRGCGPGFRACIVRFCGLPRAGGAGGGATVAAGHKTGLPRGRGAGIRRNGRQNRQAGLPRAVGGGGAAPASVPASLDFATCRAREGTRVAAQRSLPGIKPACRAGGARVSGGMIGKIVRPACRARWAAGGGRCPVQPFFCKKEEARHRGFARAALHESGRGCEYYRRGE